MSVEVDRDTISVLPAHKAAPLSLTGPHRLHRVRSMADVRTHGKPSSLRGGGVLDFGGGLPGCDCDRAVVMVGVD